MKKLIAISFLLICCGAAVAQRTDRWYILSLGAKPVGYFHDSSVLSDDGVNGVAKMYMKISRLGSETLLDSRQASAEDSDGKLRSYQCELLYSKQLSTTEVKVDSSAVRVTNEAGGKQSSTNIPYTGRIYGNEGIRKLTFGGLKKVGDSIVYQLFSPELGMVLRGTRKLLARESIEIGGNTYASAKVQDTYKEFPIIRESWLDSDGRLLKSSEPNPFGQMTLVLCTEKVAQSIAKMKIELSDDQYAATIARSNVRLPQPRQMETMVIKIKQLSPEAGFPDFAGTYQHVIERAKDYVMLRIDRPAIGTFKENLPPAVKNDFMESSYFINKDDTLVTRMVNQIVGAEKDPWKKGLLIRDWVNKNMKFNPGIAMAPSSEVIRNLEGTCVSFATLATTLYRAAGIPSRYLMGYVYADGMWGGHAWVEVFVADSWVPIDAAMASPGGVADAARFYYTRSSVKNGLGECMIGGAQLYGNVSIEILEYTLAGQSFKAGSKLYDVKNNVYDNPGLGITMSPPAGFVFNSLDEVYPESIILSMDNKQTKEWIRLYQDFISPRSDVNKTVRAYMKENKMEADLVEINENGHKRINVVTSEKALTAITNGVDIYLFVASGKRPEAILQTALKGFTFRRF